MHLEIQSSLVSDQSKCNQRICTMYDGKGQYTDHTWMFYAFSVDQKKVMGIQLSAHSDKFPILTMVIGTNAY